ncbi:hypothetical protein GYMLUDRAFT_88534 [Collybiopsis luxurians FD-317 M1]|uniref:Uncharacterized protein n=1 Tax=Collybiopsis luxurians FD-317 M1 TaxID=944289 RepID=A0A0D0C5A7_9AGAR|nr:hypothetical protein GYMLUDRAFT_88534 [Collybiopsis luxurians FD-317 M1]
MQLSNIFKALLVASACLVPSIAAGPALLDALAKKEDCCDPNFFFPCLLAENLGCDPDGEYSAPLRVPLSLNNPVQISTSAPTKMNRTALRFALVYPEPIRLFAARNM